MKLAHVLFIIASFTIGVKGHASNDLESLANYHDSAYYARVNFDLDNALYYAMRAEALYYDLGLKEDSLERIIHIDFVEAFRLIDNKELMVDHLRRVLELYEREKNTNQEDKYLGYSDLFNLYMSLNRLDSATKYVEIALQEAIKGGDILYITSALNNIGICNIKSSKWEEAMIYFNRSIDTLERATKFLDSNSNNIILCSIRDNQSDYYFHKKDSSNGIKMIEQNVAYLLSRPISNDEEMYKRVIRYGLKLSNIYIRKNRLREAENIINEIMPALSKTDEDWYLEQAIEIIRAKLQISELEGTDGIKSKYYSEIDSLMQKKLIRTLQLNKSLNKTISAYMMVMANREMANIRVKANKEKEANRIKLILLFITLLLLGVVAALVVINSKRKLEKESSERMLKDKELELNRLEKEKLNVELENQEKDLTSMVMQSALKKDWNSEIINSLERISYGKAKIDSYDLNEIIRGLKQKSTAYEIVGLQEKSIKEVNTSFYTNLIELFPDLTSAEKEMCKLIRMKLGGNEIATIRNINPSSVRKLRQRLRKKLNLNPNQDIYDFIAKI